MGFPRQEYWGGLPLPSPGHLPDPEIKSATLKSPALAGGLFISSTTWEAPFLPFRSVQFSSVAQSCPTLCNPMNRSTPGLPSPSPRQRQECESLGVVVELNRVCTTRVTMCAYLVQCVQEHVFAELRLCTPICLWICKKEQ